MPRAPFTVEQLARAIKAANRFDPPWYVEVTSGGVIRILPGQADSVGGDVDKWFSENGEGDFARRA